MVGITDSSWKENLIICLLPILKGSGSGKLGSVDLEAETNYSRPGSPTRHQVLSCLHVACIPSTCWENSERVLVRKDVKLQPA